MGRTLRLQLPDKVFQSLKDQAEQAEASIFVTFVVNPKF